MRIAVMAALVIAAGTMAALAQTVAPLPKAPTGPTAAPPPPIRMAPKQSLPEPPKTNADTPRTDKASNQEYTDCLGLWDAKTHMTRQEWSATCKRVQSRLNTIN